MAHPNQADALSPTETMCDQSQDAMAVRETLSRVGDKWTMLVMGTLADQPLRFSEIQRAIPGISQRMLTRTLRQLERDGLVGRTVFAAVPLRVVYEVTTFGQSLVEPVSTLARWALDHQAQIEQARRNYDERTP